MYGPILLKPFTVADCDMDADGIIYVNARKYIGARVGGIEPRYDGGADILIRINDRPEVRSVRKYGARCV